MTGPPSLAACLSSAPDERLRLRDDAYRPAAPGHHLASPPPGPPHRPCTQRGGDVLHSSGPTQDVGERWHNACREHKGALGAAAVRPTLPTLGLRGTEDPPRAAAAAEGG